MDFSLREWLIILGALVILGVLLDGYRRMRSGRRNSIKLAIDKNLKFRKDDRVDYFNGELPNGGARVVKRPDQESLDEAGEYDPDLPDDELMPDPLFADGREDYADDYEEFEVVSTAEDEPAAAAETADSGKKAAPPPAEPLPERKVEEVIVINVFAKGEEGLNGADILRLVLACGMRYGEMDIFHRTEDKEGKGLIQFSMANAVKPGTFDLDQMENFHTPGVSFFLSLPGPKESMKAFDYMLETAQCLANNLNGEMQDELHSVMTKQTIEHSRQKIRDFERRQLSLLR